MVTDETVEKALHWMSENAEPLADSRARMEDAAQDMKSVEALYIASEDCGVERARAAARQSQDFKDARAKHFKYTHDYELLRRRWELAALKCELWRTQEASARQGHM